VKKPVKGRAAKSGDGIPPPAPRKASPDATPVAGRFDATVTVVNKRGLHARAAAKFVKLAGNFEAEVTVTAVKGGLAGGAVVTGRSIMGLMMLAAGPGAELNIAAEGPDARAALAALSRLVEQGFDEED
jgi:phosphocarrier protein HPr